MREFKTKKMMEINENFMYLKITQMKIIRINLVRTEGFFKISNEYFLCLSKNCFQNS